MDKSKKKKIGVAIASLSCVTLLGLIGIVGCKTKASYSAIDDSDFKTEVSDMSGISIKAMSKVENPDGTVSITYSYTFTPASTNRIELVGALSFAQQTDLDVSTYLSYSINNSAQTFTITKLRDFSIQALFTLTSRANPSVSAVITIDCKQRLSLNAISGGIVDYTEDNLTGEEMCYLLEYETVSLTSTYTIPLVKGTDYTVDFEISNLKLYVDYDDGVINKTFPASLINLNTYEESVSLSTFQVEAVPAIISNGYLSESEIEQIESEDFVEGYFYYDFTETVNYKNEDLVLNYKIIYSFDNETISWGTKPSAINVEGGSIVFD